MRELTTKETLSVTGAGPGTCNPGTEGVVNGVIGGAIGGAIAGAAGGFIGVAAGALFGAAIGGATAAIGDAFKIRACMQMK